MKKFIPLLFALLTFTPAFAVAQEEVVDIEAVQADLAVTTRRLEATQKRLVQVEAELARVSLELARANAVANKPVPTPAPAPRVESVPAPEERVMYVDPLAFARVAYKNGAPTHPNPDVDLTWEECDTCFTFVNRWSTWRRVTISGTRQVINLASGHQSGPQVLLAPGETLHFVMTGGRTLVTVEQVRQGAAGFEYSRPATHTYIASKFGSDKEDGVPDGYGF